MIQLHFRLLPGEEDQGEGVFDVFQCHRTQQYVLDGDVLLTGVAVSLEIPGNIIENRRGWIASHLELSCIEACTG